MALARMEVWLLDSGRTPAMVGESGGTTWPEDREEGCPDRMRPGVPNWTCCYLGHVTAFLHTPGDKG